MSNRAKVAAALCCVVAMAGCGSQARLAAKDGGTAGSDASAVTATSSVAPSVAPTAPGTTEPSSAPTALATPTTPTVSVSSPDTAGPPVSGAPDSSVSLSTDVVSQPAQTTLVAADSAAPGGSAPSTALIAAANAVSISDPFPTAVETADPTVAEAAVRFGYQHWILVDMPKDLRARLIENGEANADNIQTEMQNARGLLTCARVAVEGVQFTTADHAAVQFWVLCGTSVSSYFPNENNGGAIFADGSWRIDRHTLCMLAFAAGQDCAGNLTNLPTPAAALVATVVPAGFALAPQGGNSGPLPGVPVIAASLSTATTDSGPSTPNAVPVPGIALWADSTGTRWFSIGTQVLRGVSELTPADLTATMASSRFGGPTATSVTVGGRPGRLLSAGAGSSPSMTLTVVRADDIVVTITATGMSAERLESIEAGLQPAS